MFTTAQIDKFLNTYRNTAYSTYTPHLGLISAITNLRAGTVTEASYSGYARDAIGAGWDAAAAGLGGRYIQNTAERTWGAKSDAGSVNFMAVGVWSLLSGGDLNNIILLGGLLPFSGVVDGGGVTGNTIAASNHGLAADQRVRVLADPAFPALPTGLSEDTDYWVINPANDTIQLSTSQGGGAQDITGEGGLIIAPYTLLTVNQNDQPRVPAGSLKIRFG